MRPIARLAAVLAVFCAAARADDAGPVISVIEITGLRLIDEGLVRGALGLEVGQPLPRTTESARLRTAVDALAELGWFYWNPERPETASSFQTRRDADGNLEIHIRLVENPVIERIDLLGGLILPREVLAEEVTYLREGRPLNTNLANVRRSLRDIEAIFRARGRTVTCQLPAPGESPPWFEETPTGGVVVHIKVIAEGADEPRPGGVDQPGVTQPGGQVDEPLIPDEELRITAVEIRGLRRIAEEVVRSVIQTQVGQVYNLEQIRADEDALHQLGWFYFSSDRERLLAYGYPLPAGGVASRVVPQPDLEERTVTVYFELVENPVIAEVRVQGNELVPTETLLGALVYLRAGEVLNTSPDRVAPELRRLSEAYDSQGFLAFPSLSVGDDAPQFLTVQPDQTVVVHVDIDEIHVGTIAFDWGDARPRTSERVFRAYMRTKSGDPYNRNTIQDDLREINRLNILEVFEVGGTEIDPADPNVINITFNVIEKRTGNIGAGGGISSRFGLVGYVEVSESNLWGLAQHVAGRVEFGGRFDFSGEYFWPLLDGAGSELSFRLYNTEDRTGASGLGAFSSNRTRFDQTRRGGEIRFSRPLMPSLRGSVQYTFQNVTTERRGSLLPSLPAFPFQDLNSDTTSSITLGINHDTRDFPFDSTSGGYRSGTVEIAGLGGDNNFTKYRVELRQYFPLFGETVEISRRERSAWVLALRGMYGFSTGRLPFSQSYLIGGSDTLRGYEEDEFFGSRAFLFNLELRRQFQNNLGAVVFFDAGRAWREGEDVDFLNDLATAVGVGLRVVTPIGPLRLDLGFGGSGEGKLHFGFGNPF